MHNEMTAFEKPSLVLRIAVGKGVGFCIGLFGLIVMPYVLPDASWLLRIGVLLWYTTMGAVIGVFGVFDHHPVLKFPMPWWVRGIIIGGWMNCVLTFFAYDTMRQSMTYLFGPSGVLHSPFWLTVEGAVVGLIIAFFATRIGGEGSKTVKD